MVRELDDPVFMGDVSGPMTKKKWGHFEVGGKKLHCHGAERYYNDPNFSFVWERLEDIVQGQQDEPNTRWSEYRQIDYE
eukprot:5872743-Karenia_brevis.AAC.1